ncbi:MAG: DUF1508 domain-containing protein [Saprospiraceae bacterium]
MRIRSFRNEKKNQYYFRVFNSIDEQVLKSEAYEAKAGRDNGINSFKKNAPFPERYERLTSTNGKFYFNVKAANHQIVATSLMFDSEEKRESVIAEIIAYATSAGGNSDKTPDVQNLAATPNPTNENNGNKEGKEQDDYHDLSFYENSGTDTVSGFDRFQKGNDNYYYFSFKSDDGKVLLLSQGYTAESGRNNGIKSVEKNATVEKRYSIHNTDDGKFYFTLKAGNHQEIARSADFDSEIHRNRAMSILMNGGGAMTEPEMMKASGMGDGKELDDYMNCGFYEDSGTGAVSGFDRFQKGDHDFHYFSFISDDGKVIVKSQGYKSEAGRDNGIASVEKNGSIEKRYAHHTSDDGKFFFTLKAGNHQEIARSCDFDTEDDMKKAIAILMNGGGAMIEPEVVKATPKSSKDGMDDYRTFGFYKDSGTDIQNGWDRFHSKKDNEYYFSYKVDGEPILISEGYTTEPARENGIASVEKNWSIDKRYKHYETPGGRYYYTIRAGNHQEIARSKWYSSAEERDGGISWLLAGGLAGASALNLAASPPPVEKVIEKTIETVPAKSVEVEDDYLPCKEYEGHEINDKVNNVAFFKHKNGQFYFVIYKADGSVRLRSEGFETATGRDEELSGVLKNLDDEKMYETITRGKYSMYILKDKTGREVGRSCLEKEEEKAAPIPVVEAVAATAVAAAVVAEVEPEAPKEKEDDYLPCKEYEGHDVNDTVNNVAFFKHKNGQFYFVIYKEDGSVRLRSEGFEKAKTRDVELSGVLKNLDNPDMYETLSRGKYRIHILSDATGREVGRSCLETVEEIIAAPPVVEAAAATAIAAAVSAIDPEPEPVVAAEPDKEDDYLPCKEYENRKVSDKKNNVAFFKHSDGQFYFVIYKSDGTVRLRSEGFRNSRERDSELSGALKNLENADMYETTTRGKYSLHILKDKTGREVGRSCLETESNPLAIPIGAAAAAAVVAAVVPDPVIEVEEEIITPVAPVVVAKTVEKAPPVVAAAAAESGGGGFNWKWLLLLLPLLLAFLFWKGCDGCSNTTPPPPVTDPTPIPEPAPVDTAKVEVLEQVPEPAPVPEPVSCNCTGSSNNIFNIPSNKTPKVLTRLGTNPEFGNSHSLDAVGFYNKLKNAHAANDDRDRRFLDNLFKAMGYENGFAGANAGLFSETTISRGTIGNMGYSYRHLTKYSKLNATGKDLEAFKIKAANGCDIHFMKTCGNHFFFCPK